jgi:hypothetical protein
MKYTSGLALLALVSLSACGGGGASGPQTVPSGGSNSVTSVTTAVASVSFKVPKADPGTNIGTSAVTTSSASRKPQYLSPGTDKFSFMLDKKEVVADQEVVNFNNAGPSGNGTFTDPVTGSTVQISYDGSHPTYYAVNAVITTTPGQHEFGVVIKSGTPAYVLSEGQGNYTLAPTFSGQSPQSLGALVLNGAVGTGYIECDTWAQNTDTTNPAGSCSNGANFAGGTYYFTAVAADYDGFPIVNQGSTAFDNGSYSVVETDGKNVVAIGSNGPFSLPGSWLTGPSSGWVAGSTFQYGNRFTATCNTIGTATLGLQFSPNVGGHPAVAIDGYNYNSAYAPPSQLDGSILPLGGKTTVVAPRLPQYNVTVNCNASGNLSIQ